MSSFFSDSGTPGGLGQADEELLQACPPMPVLKLSRNENSANWGSTFLNPFYEYDIPPRCYANYQRVHWGHAVKNIFSN